MCLLLVVGPGVVGGGGGHGGETEVQIDGLPGLLLRDAIHAALLDHQMVQLVQVKILETE